MSIFPEALQSFFIANQNLLWVATLCADLGLTVLLYHFFGARGLLAAIVLSILLSNLQGPKLTIIFGMQTSLGVIFYSSIFFATDLLSERFGRAEANRAVLIGFSVSVIIVVMLSLGLLFQPSDRPASAEFSNDIHNAFVTILDFTPRFVFGSLFAYLVSQSFDVWFFHKIKEKTQGRHLWLRNNLSTMASQTIDTLLYSFVVWWGVVDLATALQLGIVKYGFKLAIAMIDTPFIYWARSWPPHKDDRV
ncbi:MAG: queuosine precursor transporter [Gammaproteobacteria bacterium]|nr:queuosine precursor transporter [Gammaproteobacteria bacterium]MBT8443189.1 queuosine precursor transporter [Gammaproteobacteria bacterium]NND35584.1 queuosine precursor transporter [Gammaproteobacteria bacterium]